MESKQPWLEVLSPEGQRREIPLTQDRMSIGREGYQSDLPLGPDPNSFIFRSHCYLERKHSGWWLTENGKNATLLRQNEELQEIRGQVLLSDGSTFCLLGLVDENGTRLYWSLTLHDPGQTQSDPFPRSAPLSLKWDRARAALWRLRGKQTEEIQLTTHEWKLIDYIFERNRCARNAPVLCTDEELLVTVYGEPLEKIKERLAQPKDSLRHLIEGLRRKLEVNPQEPRFLVGHRGQGYILYTYLSSR
ncbi:MAG: winged helix-turn-helix domain-containing protein [Ktedonobacteraceae bacterium]|nr:winged helix-turn-helix domain-containing protein [Ktedonobacteraceae bacterium]